MRVDNYTATVSAKNPNDVLEWLREALPGETTLGADGSTKRWRYDHAFPFLVGKSHVATVRYGGNAGGVSIELKGSVSDETYGFLRAKWPEHAVTRLDVAVDGTRPGLFDEMVSRIMTIRDELPANRRPKLNHMGDWHTPAGRTLYVGSKEGGAQVVCYEKGHEQAHKQGIENPDPDWTRLELRLYPDRDTKRLAASLLPLDAWGWNAWAADFLEAFTGLEPNPVQKPRRVIEDDFEFYLVATFGDKIQQLSQGDWAAFGARLGEHHARYKAFKTGSGRSQAA